MEPREVNLRFRLPRVPSGLAANLLGLAGLVAMALAIGGLTGNWWWSVLAGGVFATALAWIAQTQQAAEQAEPANVRPIAAAKSA